MKALPFKFLVKFGLFLFFATTSIFSLFAGDAYSLNLSSGDPSLRIICNSKSQYVIYINQPWPAEGVHPGGYAIDTVERRYPERQIVLSRADSIFANGELNDPEVLYPFDEHMAFTCDYGSGWSSDADAYKPKKYNYWPRKTQVFSTNEKDILVTDDVYALARSRYSLTTNQLFLGKIGTTIFYWETLNPTKVYYRATNEEQAAKYFKLPKSVLDLSGITKAVGTNMDIGIWAYRRKQHWEWFSTTAPYETAVYEFMFKNARRVKSAK